MVVPDKAKYFSGGEAPEKTYHSYSPSFGGDVVDDASLIDPRILSARKSGLSLNDLNVSFTSWRIKYRLSINSIVQEIVTCYSDLKAIQVCAGLLGFPRLALRDNRGLTIWLDATRPHFVAVELWYAYSCIVLAEYERQGRLDSLSNALSLINSLDVSTVRVPDDFLSVKGEAFKCQAINHGFVFPVDSQPSLNPEIVKANWGKPVPVAGNRADSGLAAPVLDSEVSCSVNNQEEELIMPLLRDEMKSCLIASWHRGPGSYFKAGDRLFSVEWCGEIIPVLASNNGELKKVFKYYGSRVKPGDAVGQILVTAQESEALSNDISLVGPRSEISLTPEPLVVSTSSAMQRGSLHSEPGSVPVFSPSLATVPDGFLSTGSVEEDLAFAISNPTLGFQTFFNSCKVITVGGIDDDVINYPCFDEDLYARLVREMHRYTLAEVADRKETLAKEKANLGTFVGSLLGVFTLNPLAPFLGRNLGRLEADRGKRVEEFLPDPHLLFYQDDHSFLSWSRAQVLAPRLRRLMIIPMVKEGGNVYFRLLPAIVTPDSVYPLQLFKLTGSSFFYRPFAAGIERLQGSYDAVKVQRRYTHVRSEGQSHKLDMTIPVFGADIEDYCSPLYSFSGQGLDYLYVDFKILPGFIF